MTEIVLGKERGSCNALRTSLATVELQYSNLVQESERVQSDKTSIVKERTLMQTREQEWSDEREQLVQQNEVGTSC